MSRSCHSATFSTRRVGVAAEHPREAGDALRRDRVALVRHRARALLLARSETAPRPRGPRCAEGGGSRSRAARARRRRARSPAAARRGGRAGRPGSRPARRRCRAAPARGPRTSGPSEAYVPTAPDSAPTLACANARSSRSALRCASNAKPASLMPNVVGSACTPCVRPTQTVSTCSRAFAASAADELARAGEHDRPRRPGSAAPSAVSSTSELVSPKWIQRPPSPALGARARRRTPRRRGR